MSGLGLEDGIEQATIGLNKYGQMSDVWRIAISGGKDSTCLGTLIYYLLKTKKVPWPKKIFLTVVDTLQEIPALIQNAERICDLYRGKAQAIRIRPSIENSFHYHLLGRGLFPPGGNKRTRWCTRVLKQDPMDGKRQKVSWADQYGVDQKTTLSLYGSRIDESDSRAKNMMNSCTLEGSECGTGLFMQNEGLKYAPLTNWRNCTTWDWIQLSKKLTGYNPSLLMDLYSNIDEEIDLSSVDPDQIPEILDATTRTGCMGCPVIAEDYALKRVSKKPHWEHLKPYIGLHSLYMELREHHNRLIKPDGRIGPLTLDARKFGLSEILSMQRKSQRIAKRNEKPEVTLITPQLKKMIDKAIKDGIFPRGWTGNEPIARDSRSVGEQLSEVFE